MLRIIIFVAIALFLIGIFVYQLIMPIYAAKKGRQVDVRVLSCEQKADVDEEAGEIVGCYEVTVDFYDLNGKVLVKTIQSEKQYMVGDVIRCSYLDKTGTLFPETAFALQEGVKHGVVVFVIFFLVFMGVVAAILWGMQHVSEQSEGAVALVFGYFISIVFIAVGILGIHKKVKRLQDANNMLMYTGVLVDYTEEISTDSDGDTQKVYHPIYEYDWGGEKRRLFGNAGSSGKKYRTIGRQVHILVNPKTGEAICREDENANEGAAVAFGVIGVAVFALMLALSLGVLPNGGGTQEESSAGLSGASMEKARILELFYHYENMELEICDCWVDIYEDGSGRLLLFPVKTVSGKGIDQEIAFTVSQKDMERIMEWLQKTDVESLTRGPYQTDKTTAYASLNIYDGGEQHSGGGYCDEGIYAEICGLIQEAVPADAWEEMEKREAAYYQR